jgi:transposase
MGRRNFTEDFKTDAVKLVVEQNYSYPRACEALGMGESALRRWVAQWHAEQSAPPRDGAQASADARRIRELEARVADLQRERDILKKSTAFFVKELDRSSK